jgi:hypothetical protein
LGTEQSYSRKGASDQMKREYNRQITAMPEQTAVDSFAAAEQRHEMAGDLRFKSLQIQ